METAGCSPDSQIRLSAARVINLIRKPLRAIAANRKGADRCFYVNNLCSNPKTRLDGRDAAQGQNNAHRVRIFVEHAIDPVGMKLDRVFRQIGRPSNPEAAHQFLGGVCAEPAASSKEALRAVADFGILHQCIDQFLCDDVFWFGHAHPIFQSRVALNRAGMNTICYGSPIQATRRTRFDVN